MIPTKFKQTSEINLKSKLLEYFIKLDINNEQLITFITQLQLNRNVISNLKMTYYTLEEVERLRTILTVYISDLNALKSKISFGNSNGINIEFIWNDTIKNKKWKSKNIEFEYYNSIFNLASCYFMIGIFRLNKLERNNSNDSIIIKNFRYANYLFDLIKREAHQKIEKENLPYDLNPYCAKLYSTFSIIKSQLTFIELGERQQKYFEYLGKNYNGISKLYKNCYELCIKEPLINIVDKIYIKYLYNRIFYYKGKMYLKLKEKEIESFNKDGKRFKYALSYQTLAVINLQECQKTINEVSIYTNVNEFNIFLEKEKKEREDMNYKNKNIYRDGEIDLSKETIEEVIRDQSLIPQDLFIENMKPEINSDYYNKIIILNNIIDPKIKMKVYSFREQMKKYFTLNIANLENEISINSFINSFNLPKRLTSNDEEQNLSFDIQIPLNLWNKIETVQNLGGITGLLTAIQNIINHSEYTLKILNETLYEMNSEEKEDFSFRNQFGKDKWIIVPSNELNKNIVMSLNNHINNLNQMSVLNFQQKNDVLNNSEYFQILSESQGTLNQRIPGSKIIKNNLNKEENETKQKILFLKDLSQKNEKLKNSVFNYIENDNKIIQLFYDEKYDEKSIFNSQKAIIDLKINELKKKSDEIKNCENEIKVLISKIPPPDNNIQIPKEAQNFFNNLNAYADFFIKKYNKFKSAGEYFDNLHKEIYKIIKIAKEFLDKRMVEKKALFKYLTGKEYDNWKNPQNNNNNKVNTNDTNAFLDPNNNIFTNMNVFNGLSSSYIHGFK